MTLHSQEKKEKRAVSADDVGLSSAMHDIRMLAASYEEQRGRVDEREPELAFGGATMDPRLLLVPKLAPRTDYWRVAALGLMVLLGLSASALALTLYRNVEPPASSPTTLYVPPASGLPESDVSSSMATPEIVRPREPALYRMPSTPGDTASPQTHQAQSPTVTLRTSAEPRARRRSTRVVEPVSSCDEVACILDSSDPCCEQFESVREHEIRESPSTSRPYRPTRAQAIEPLRGIQNRVRGCFDKHDYRGVATVTLRIAPKGRVQGFELADGSPAFQRCVQDHVQAVRFGELRQPFTLSYPFTYR